MNKTIAPLFPCSSLPEDSSECRLLGLYPQRRDGLWLQRIKIPGGVVTANQWSALAAACRRYTPSTPLYLTTRQDMEFHNITPDVIPHLQADLIKAGFSGLGACGNTLRNITVCPGNGLCEGTPDVTSVALTVENELKNFPGIYTLPRKFKISFSSCTKACAQPWINDLGFVADLKDGTVTFKVIGAGSLGSRPVTGIILKKGLLPGNVPALALAAVQLFNEHGDRKHRSRARLRHARIRLGDSQFLQLLDRKFKACLNKTLPPVPPVTFPDRGYSFVSELNIPYGALKIRHMEAIAHLTEKDDVVARLQNHHRLSLFALNTVSALKAVTDNCTMRELVSPHNIVSCPGSTFCKHALVNTHAVEKDLRGKLPETREGSIRISGCPNGCAHSGIADIGLVGKIRKDDAGNRIEGFQILTGGGSGLTQSIAQSHSSFVPSAEIPDLLLKL